MTQESYAQQVKGKKGLRRIFNAAGYSKDGFCSAYRYESAFRQLVWLNGALLVLAFVLDFGPASRMMLITASFISLIVELVNTATKLRWTTPPPRSTNWPSAPKMPARPHKPWRWCFWHCCG